MKFKIGDKVINSEKNFKELGDEQFTISYIRIKSNVQWLSLEEYYPEIVSFKSDCFKLTRGRAISLSKYLTNE